MLSCSVLQDIHGVYRQMLEDGQLYQQMTENPGGEKVLFLQLPLITNYEFA